MSGGVEESHYEELAQKTGSPVPKSKDTGPPVPKSRKRSATAGFFKGLFGCGRNVSPPSSPEMSPAPSASASTSSSTAPMSRKEANKRSRNGTLPRNVTVLGPPPAPPTFLGGHSSLTQPLTERFEFSGFCTMWGVPSYAMFCIVFFRKFQLPIGLHSICSISQTAGGTCQKSSTKHHE